MVTWTSILMPAPINLTGEPGSRSRVRPPANRPARSRAGTPALHSVHRLAWQSVLSGYRRSIPAELGVNVPLSKALPLSAWSCVAAVLCCLAEIGSAGGPPFIMVARSAQGWRRREVPVRRDGRDIPAEMRGCDRFDVRSRQPEPAGPSHSRGHFGAQ